MPVFGRSFTILFVVVPLAARRRVGVHQVAEASSLPAVEILHLERLAGAGPLVERRRVTQELVARHHLAAEVAHQRAGGDRVRLGDHDLGGRELVPVSLDAAAHRGCVTMIDDESRCGKLRSERLDGSGDETDSSGVPRPRRNLVGGSDQQHSVRLRCRISERADVAVELVPEHPDGGERFRSGSRHGADANAPLRETPPQMTLLPRPDADPQTTWWTREAATIAG